MGEMSCQRLYLFPTTRVALGRVFFFSLRIVGDFSKMAAGGRVFRTLATVRGLNTKSTTVVSPKRNEYLYSSRVINRLLSTADESTQEDTKTKKFELTFEEFQKLRRKLRTSQRIAGLPIGVSALLTSSAISAYLNPNMFDAPPEQIQPIL